jgi:nitrogen fixation/metabolism regulation signal transduction histidine kinase
MRQNVTEPEEEPIVAAIEGLAPRALGGDVAARSEAALALRRLGEVNRAAMRRADEEARRLSRGGAWGVVFLGLTALIASIGVSRRLRHRAVEPLGALDDAVDAYVRGDGHRRARALDSCEELKRLSANVNKVLDAASTPVARAEHRADPDGERAVLLHLLDQQPHATIVADEEGEILAANQQALNQLAATGGNKLRTALRGAVAKAVTERDREEKSPNASAEGAAGEPAVPTIRAAEVPAAKRWICVVDAA